MKPTRLVAVLCHPIVIGAAALVTAVALRRKRGVPLRLAVAVPLGWGASKIAKRLYPKQKPRLLTLTPRESFPSGHATAMTAFATALVEGLRSWRGAPVALAAIGIVDASRVHDREHRLSEVLAGNAIGLVAAAVGSAVARHLYDRSPRNGR